MSNLEMNKKVDHYGKNRIGRLYLLWRKINFPSLYQQMIKQAVSELDLQKGNNVLDVACGPGYNFKNILEKVGGTGRITAIDYSKYMLKVAATRAKKNNINNIEFIEMDAAKLNYKEKFDAAIIVLGLSVIPDWKRALKNIIKAVKVGGKIVILDDESLDNSLSGRLIYRFVDAKEREITSEIKEMIKKDVRVYHPSDYFIFSGKK